MLQCYSKWFDSLFEPFNKLMTHKDIRAINKLNHILNSKQLCCGFFLIVEIYPQQLIAVFVAGEIKQDISSIYNSNENQDKHKLSDIIKNKIIERRELQQFQYERNNDIDVESFVLECLINH